MKYKIKRLAALLLVALLVCSTGGAAWADTPDPSRICSVSFYMHYGAQPVSGGSLSLYRVAGLNEISGRFSYQAIGGFVGCGEDFDDFDDTAMAARLRAYADSHNIQPTVTAEVNAAGRVSFAGLNTGLYLVVQRQAAPGYYAISPFLITLPYLENGVYKYDLSAEPKTQLEPIPAPPTPTPTPPPFFPPPHIIPQTGQLWWPIPILVCAGLAFIAAGFAIKRRTREDEN